ncbi:XdhC family protein [Arthrobacter sp. NPDC058130]|uniref:XdhC family protein n=1 Tax=Arthrobacter sp. NPDC058130 TaxID=3346353 RepID=UPI0036E56537
MLDLMPSLKEWQPAVTGQRFAVATVVGAAGSVPRPLGTSMIVSEAGAVLGSLSGGCVEGAVVELALEALRDGGTRCEVFGFSADDAFAAGLTCGGELEVHIEPLGTEPGALRPEDLAALAAHGPATALALIRRVDANGGGAVVIPDPATYQAGACPQLAALLGFSGLGPSGGGLSGLGSPAGRALMEAAAAQLEPLLRRGQSGLVRLATQDGCLPDPLTDSGSASACGRAVGVSAAPASNNEPVTLLVQSRRPPPRLLIFGANDFGAALLPAAQLLGYGVTLCDARPAFAAQDRFASADHVVAAWPHRYLAEEAAAGRIDRRTVVCILTHDSKFDIPLLETALGLELGYVGAMGSRRSHQQRIESLLAAGMVAEKLSRLHSPIGLDLGAVTPAEVAVSITAEILAYRESGLATANPRADGPSASCMSLKDGSGPIHQRGGRAAAPESASQPHSPESRSLLQHQETPWI